MKKSIVLLITLLFIATISILVLKNLKDSQDLIDTASFDKSLSQIAITMDNLNNEIPRFLKSKEDDIDTILSEASNVPLSYGNVNVVLNLEDANNTQVQFDLNDLNESLIRSNQDFANNVGFTYDFFTIAKRHKKEYSNEKQVMQMINEYIKRTKDKNILNIKDDFTYFSNSSGRLIRCNYTVRVNEYNVEASLLFDLNSSVIKSFNIINIF